MIEKLAIELFKKFSTDQSFHLQQQNDGAYWKKPGAVSAKLIERTLYNKGSIAIFQKNQDSTVNWVCFDFDILTAALNRGDLESAQRELKNCVQEFCVWLDDAGLRYILEFSGNRGFHVWLIMGSPISQRAAFGLQREILIRSDLEYDNRLIGIDLFPKAPNPTTGLGNGVKMPFSLHAKSRCYAVLLGSSEEIISSSLKYENLQDIDLKKSVDILQSYLPLSKLELEEKLGLNSHALDSEVAAGARVRAIHVRSPGFTVKALLDHWRSSPLLGKIAQKVCDGALSNDERKLIVGILCNVRLGGSDANYSLETMIQIFALTKNFDKARTEQAIKKLSSFTFPSQNQIEFCLDGKFERTLSTEDLIKRCIPGYVSYDQGNFDLCASDIEVTRIAELNYLFANDEAQSRLTINQLVAEDVEELQDEVERLIADVNSTKFYKHIRVEEGKTRVLYSLGAPGRVATSALVKQLVHFLDLKPSQNSFGYRINKGFAKSQIFQPWLYKWVEFTGNIEAAISDPDYKNYYIVKTDISKYYDEIPHDSIKRLILDSDDVNIKAKVELLSNSEREKYSKIVDCLFSVSKLLVGGIKGLPQGPAYARWLAEIYLRSLDALFDEHLASERVYLYQRYVDDIFFIAKDEVAAKNFLDQIKKHLANLGLLLNLEKTSVVKISNFSAEFDKYRSQSKYSVDTVAKNFNEATEAEKNNAISEFLKIVQSDTCADDLAFIYSHLQGVDYFDKWKREKAASILSKKIGRGSMFRHLFSFIVEDPKNWERLGEVEKFTCLQSEVLTSVLFEYFSTGKNIELPLADLMALVLPKLETSEIVEEHIALIYISFGEIFEISRAKPEKIVECLGSCVDFDKPIISNKLLMYINTELNQTNSLRRFVRVLYSLCASDTIQGQGLNDLASVFFAKISSDYRSKKIEANSAPELSNRHLAAKFHFLICLYSVSKLHAADELLRAVWSYCIHLHNLFESDETPPLSKGSWLKKIDLIEIDPKKVMLFVSAIIDGNFVRGIEDRHRVFEQYHSTLLVYFVLSSKRIDAKELSLELSKLSETAEFYKWLLHSDGVHFFPSNRDWFEKNLLKNDVIMLRRGSQILIRRAESEFAVGSNPINAHQGYAEIIIDYDQKTSISISEYLDGRSVKEKVMTLESYLLRGKSFQSFPNLFTYDQVLKKDTLDPVSKEFEVGQYLVFEGVGEIVDAFENNEKNFVSCYLSLDRTEPGVPSFKYICERYVNNLDHDIEVSRFINAAAKFLPDDEKSLDEFSIDIALSTALYSCIGSENSSLARIDKFSRQYSRFRGSDHGRHIFAVDDKTVLVEGSPSGLLCSLQFSLSKIRDVVYPTFPFFLDKDILEFEKLIARLVSLISPEVPVSLKRVTAIALPASEKISVSGEYYPFENVRLINVYLGIFEVALHQHVPLINSAEHIYSCKIGGDVFLLPMPTSISRMFAGLKFRFESIFSHGAVTSYPVRKIITADIFSQLRGFSKAAAVISVHRQIPTSEAVSRLERWLEYVPAFMQQTLVTLIAAHVQMDSQEIREFLDKVRALLESDTQSAICIKRVEDMGGAHRLMISDSRINRKLDLLHPRHVKEGVQEMTVIVDNIISGKQLVDAFKHYLMVDVSSRVNMYFSLEGKAAADFRDRLLGLKRINICTVLYVEKNFAGIQEQLRNLISSDLKVEIVNGRDMQGDATFSTTQKIGENDKAEIRDVLLSAKGADFLNNFFEKLPNGKSGKALKLEDINSANLVARYQSLPKKSFWFLSASLRADPTSHPLVRILENNEIKKGSR
ncbi:reverse transcriptase domain-containing protein [Variovorax sp. RCC_210]|uniref:reverse transcriptase domain-containing protein n=1 Tax=Variovorax sp. RCC_210 TaxID=3239217 RepID=UPI003525B340